MLSITFPMFWQLDIMNLEILRLPITPLMLENACFLMQEQSITAWPLVCDPASRIIDWLRFNMKDKGLVEVRYNVSIGFWLYMFLNPFPHNIGAFWCLSSRWLLENMAIKEEIAQNKQFLLFVTMFSTLFNYCTFS